MSIPIPRPWLPIALFHGINLGGLLLAIGFTVEAQDELRLPHVDLAVSFFMAAAMVLVPLNALFTRSLLLPYRRVWDALDRGTDPAELAPDDVRAVLTMSRRVVRSLAVQWLVPTLSFPLVVLATGRDLDRAFAVPLVGILASTMVAATGFYAFLGLEGKLGQALLGRGTLNRLLPVRLLRVWQHLAVLGTVNGLVLPFGMLALLSMGLHSRALLACMIVGFLGVTGFVAAQIINAISTPLGHLEGRMIEVGQGLLQTRSKLYGLDTLGHVNSHFNEMVEGLQQRERIRETFGRYVSKQIAEVILDGQVELGGELRRATLLFSDIRGFTRMSERMAPGEVVAFLNEYLANMVRCVDDNHGVLDKFIGDAIMALFGVPVSRGVEEDARAAVRCALMMSDALDQLNERRQARGEDPVQIGIGVHTGDLVAGTIGTDSRREYTVIGDTVNLASRIEGLNKRLGTRLLVSDATAALLGDEFRLTELETVDVRGREQPVTVFTAQAAKQ